MTGKQTLVSPPAHRLSSDTDRCICGGGWVFFEKSWCRRDWGYGCDKANEPYVSPRGYYVDGLGQETKRRARRRG